MIELRSDLAAHSLNFARTPNSGTPLAMFHGVTRRWQSFLPLIPALASRFHVMAWDARGHGLSDRTAVYRVTDYVSDAVDFVGRHFSQPGILYGHSLGAMVALATASERPDLVTGVVLEDPPFHTMGERIEQSTLYSFFAGLIPFAGHQRPTSEVARELAEIRLTKPGSEQSVRLGDTRDAVALRFTARCLSQLAPEVLLPIVDGTWLQGYDLPSIARRVQCPVLLFQADELKGGMLSDEDVRYLCQQLPDCVPVKFPDAPHLIHWSQPESLLRHVWGFTESL